MIRFTWRSHAVSPSVQGTTPRLFSASSSRHDEPYPLLKRRRRPANGAAEGARGRQDAFSSAFASRKLDQNPWRKVQLAHRELNPSEPLDAAVARITATSRAHDSQDLDLPWTGPLRGRSGKPYLLVVSGLSPNIKAADFYRLLPSDLSSWRSIILNGTPPPRGSHSGNSARLTPLSVQQHRDPETLEPLGRYALAFDTPDAARAYDDRLRVAYELARLRARSRSGLWEQAVRPTTRLDAPSADDAPSASATADAFTLAPGEQDHVEATVARARGEDQPWVRRVARAVAPLGFGEQPPVVMLHVNPPTLTEDDLADLIRADWDRRGVPWQVGRPCSLDRLAATNGQMADESRAGKIRTDSSSSAAFSEGEATADEDGGSPPGAQDLNRWEKRRSRFLVVCASEAEARRFHRYWNQRALMGGGRKPDERNVVDASIINW